MNVMSKIIFCFKKNLITLAVINVFNQSVPYYKPSSHSAKQCPLDISSFPVIELAFFLLEAASILLCTSP